MKSNDGLGTPPRSVGLARKVGAWFLSILLGWFPFAPSLAEATPHLSVNQLPSPKIESHPIPFFDDASHISYVRFNNDPSMAQQLIVLFQNFIGDQRVLSLTKSVFPRIQPLITA